MTNNLLFFSGEDVLAEALASRCVLQVLPDFHFQSIRPFQGGKDWLLKYKMPGYFATAERVPFLLMIDQDAGDCPPSVRAEILRFANRQGIPAKLVLSVVTRESEAWLLGDGEMLAGFLDIDSVQIPTSPESENDPKSVLLSCANFSQRYREEICPTNACHSRVGPGYNAVLSAFVRENWRPLEAAKRCPSLKRTLDRLEQLKE
jgi:hypothetical protein